MGGSAGEVGSIDVLAKEYWDWRMSDEPLTATLLGDRRFDSKLQDISPEARTKRQHKYREFLEACNSIPEGPLSADQKLTRSALAVDLQSGLDYSQCALEEWTVDPLQGPQVEFANLESYQLVRTPSDAEAMVERWGAVAPYFDRLTSNLYDGISQGKVAVRACVEKVLQELEEMLAKPDQDWAFLRPIHTQHPDWSEDDRRAFVEGLSSAVRKSVRPAYARYLEFLRSEVLPKARPQEVPGIGHLPDGFSSYSRLIRFHTSLDLTPGELHSTGMKEVAKINQEMENLGEKVFGTRDRKAVLQKLRTDPSLYFSTRDEVAEKAESSLRKAKAVIKDWFGVLPKAECEVVRMEEHEEKNSTIAYYRQPAADGSRPGRYYINTSDPHTRPRYEAEALAFHESIPGHHLQIAIAQELQNLPEFRRYGGVTAFIEGWGLYTERLSDEMGLYSTDLDRIGILSYDSWRACRLVVDTGMHAMGWSRAQAIDFMLENSALAKNNIVNEVDRYITWPGQALAYKTGQLEILRLRQASKDKLGSGFDIKRFHDKLLSNGALPLQTLRQVMSQA